MLSNSVCVLNQRGKPLMPTSQRKARLLLKAKKAKIVGHRSFTIQLKYATGETKQSITLGVDAGYKNVGISIISPKKEFLSSEIQLLEGQVERNKERRMYRNNRRSKLRYRKPRFDNRSIPEGWLAPSIQHKFDSHIKFIEHLKSVFPITEVIIEVAAFDIQKIKNPDISETEYQNGEQKDFWNLREYVFHRDRHQCQSPKCQEKKEQDKNQILRTHHIGFWKQDRSNRPGNLITLCTKCHTPKNHKENGMLFGWEPKIKSFRSETFMSTVGWKMVNQLECKHTYGYLTKSKRINQKVEKTHYNDAFCVANGINQERAVPMIFKQKRRNNRSLEKFYDAKYIDIRTSKILKGAELHSGRTTRNKKLNSENLRKYRGEKKSKGKRVIRSQRYSFQPHDLVVYENKIRKVVGTHNKGASVRITDGKQTFNPSPKKLKHKIHTNSLILTQVSGNSSPTLKG